MTIPSFISDGIRFSCLNCGNCCTGAPGTVIFSEQESSALAAWLGASFDEIRSRHLRPHGTGYRIQEKENGDCPFFSERCTIYPVRPAQCRTYPFWLKNLRNETAWQHTCQDCPGIGQGRWHSPDEIIDLVQQTMPRSDPVYPTPFTARKPVP